MGGGGWDYDDDGVDDVVVAVAPEAPVGTVAESKVIVLIISGSDGHLLRKHELAKVRTSRAPRVLRIGDHDGDGRGDILLSDIYSANELGGSVTTIEFVGSVSGKVIGRAVPGAVDLGQAILEIADITGDGIREVVASESALNGEIRAIDGQTGGGRLDAEVVREWSDVWVLAVRSTESIAW